MKSDSSKKRILLIDHQPYWREISTNALKNDGFTVGTLDNYNYLPSQECVEGENPDLIVLGCAHIETAEQQLIDYVLAHKHHLLVLCTSLSWQTMRKLFLKGVDDILDKPYNPAKLVEIVNEVLASTPS
ncbi:MAG: hypothetical protein ACJ8CB_13875 [Ktedonobacteraceae bacterium]